MRARFAKISAFVLVICLGAAAAYWQRSRVPGPSTGEEVVETELTIQEKDLPAIASFVDQRWQGQPSTAPKVFQTGSEAVYLAARRKGERRAEAWGFGETAAEAIAGGIASLQEELDKGASIDTLEIFVIAATSPVESERQLFSNIRRGVQGLEIRQGDERELHSPTYALASNRKNQRLIELYVKEKKLSPQERGDLKFRFLRGPQLLVSLTSPQGGEARALLMERGNQYQRLETITQSTVDAFAKRMATWMTSSLHEDGRMTYLFWPSQGQEAPDKDNLIRQFMATIALGRIAARLPAEEASEAYRRSAMNIDYNLKAYYQREGDFGFVLGRGKAKLGSAALAALAIVEHPERARWLEEEEALLRTVQSLWGADGSFRSFYKPQTRNDNQNFYPGEALLLWATLYSQSKDEVLLEQIMKSSRYYRAWHLDSSVAKRRNPAFTPWHTQAYYMVWTHTKSEELKDFIFEMNDWLVPVQEWEGSRYRDTKGRFYDSTRPFGPPHASSTGVYLEGLVDAYSLAKSIGDQERMKRYALSIRRGLRSSMQLQFVDEVDMFYIQNRERVFGGLRTTVYNNQIRCDNVQHTLMGVQKILEAGLLPGS